MELAHNHVREQIYRLPEVLDRIGMGRAWLYAEMAEGRFPRGVSLGRRARGWLASEIDAWIAQRPERSA